MRNKEGVIRTINDLSTSIYLANVDVGWWDINENPNDRYAEKLCLIHSEISESMEGNRKNLMDDHLPHRKMDEVELADALIRILDLGGAMGFDLGGAVVEKLAYNKTRADHKKAARNAEGGKRY